MIDPQHPLVQAADWAVALALLASGVLAWRSSRATATLLGATGFAWIVGGLATPALFWHRALLVHLVLSFPGWRPASRTALAVTVATYAVCVLTPVALFVEPVTTAQALALVAAAAWNLRGTIGRTRHHRRVAMAAAGLLATAVVGGSLVRSLTEGDLSVPTLLVYETAVVSAVLVVLAGLRRPATARLTDLVIDLGETGSSTLRDALARALRDPDLRLGFWDAEAQRYLDGDGQPLELRGEPGRSTVPISRQDEPFVLLDLDAGLSDDPLVVESIKAAADISATNAQRQSEVLDEVRRLEASRRRLLVVADEERHRLARELRRGVMARLTGVADDLRDLAPHSPSTHLRSGLDHLDHTIDDLAGVAAGLRPRELADGLPEALRQLADRAPEHVLMSVTVDAQQLPREIALAVWYLCVEALSNAAKHAPGTTLRIEVTGVAGALHVLVADDGPGGALPREGGGLIGLRDRVESLGGRFAVRSDPTRGTVLAAELPLDGQHR